MKTKMYRIYNFSVPISLAGLGTVIVFSLLKPSFYVICNLHITFHFNEQIHLLFFHGELEFPVVLSRVPLSSALQTRLFLVPPSQPSSWLLPVKIIL